MEKLQQDQRANSARVRWGRGRPRGRYLGRIVPPLSVGAGKVARLRDYAARRRIELAESFVYTDAFPDAPVLEMVGHPVAVYPDARLAALAAERGWPVIGTITKERE